MNTYKIRFFNSAGYRDNEIIRTNFQIEERNNSLVVLEEGVIVGNAEMVEQLINETRGWQEANTAVSAEKVTNQR
ncbi:hypothetical protein F9L16_22565 [Agarivorans sp. B2Z047]|uniref:hypothetical protein n=1 Tax=Agarivorans sp. B2Z047 TaxID=2652721 RepID=UPI00128E4009|nr:hypothetical protein [Agarivorans sp. B2Z047]MPW31757.1 hypothetical protein [Agarivorans sp. B2Z047]UQN44817.1 hypothetical protein LQZ07_10245 [Agarivorans sp. B2Z047]